MRRGQTGRHETSSGGGESVRAFVPAPLPPVPPLELTGALQQGIESALLSVGRLDSLSTLLPDTTLFHYSYVRKEAVLSSRIEGTQSSLSDLLLFELDELPGVPIDDVTEVSNYVSALEHGLARLRDGFPLSSRLLREIHGVLLASGRGSSKEPGEFRRSQVWLGGTRPSNAAFVPPPHHLVPECMGELERFLHGERGVMPAVLRAGLAHAQFETIHPFLDGNGRVGRLLITLLLCEAAVLKQPLLYLSLHFKQNRDEYYRLLDRVRTEGVWEEWLEFYLEGVQHTADSAVSTAQRLRTLFATDRHRASEVGRRAGSALRVHDILKAKAVTSLPEVKEKTGLSFPAASNGMDVLVDLGIARELTGKRRNRVFAYSEYVTILNEEAED